MSDRIAMVGRGHEVMPRCSALLLAVLCATAASGIVSTAAAQARTSGVGQWEVPRTPDGHPDFQGNWSNSTLTPFERAEDHGPLYTPEEVAEIERPDGDCPPNPGTVACGRTARTGSDAARLSGQEYNEVYWERGSRVAVVNGEPRASLVTHPANGRAPDRTPEAQRLVQERQDFRSQFEQYDHPEFDRAVREIYSKARAKGVGAGMHFMFPQMGLEMEIEWIRAGGNLVIHSGDIIAASMHLGAEIAQLRAAVGDVAAVEPGEVVIV